MKIYNLSTSVLLENTIIVIFSIYFFLWSQSFIYFDERLLLVLLIPLYFFIENKNQTKSNYFFFLILISFISFHLVLNNFFFTKDLLQNFNAVIGSALIALIALMYRTFIISNLSKIIYFFILILFIFFLFENFLFKDFYSIKNFDCLNGWFSLGKGTSKLFAENSHFGMIAPAIISYLIFVKNEKKVVNYLNLILISFLFLFLSTTLLAGTILCLFLFLVTKFKILNNFQKITSFFLLIICLILVFSKPQCNMRVSETIEGVYINYITRDSENLPYEAIAKKAMSEVGLNIEVFQEEYNDTGDLSKESINKLELAGVDKSILNDYFDELRALPQNVKKQIKFKQDIRSKWKKNLMNESLNQSSEVTLNSYAVSINSLKNYPLGVGMNNYIISYEKYSKELSLHTWNVNKEDGSNNFAKMLSEFGVFSIVLCYFILIYALRENKNFYKNSFFYSIILTQLIRGGGYFNGGFLLSLFIILLSIFLKKNNDKKISQ